MALSFFLTSFILSVIALSISLNFRIARFLNLSLAGVFAAGAYMAYFSAGVILSALTGFVLGLALAYYVLRVCRSVIEATIASLGVGLLVERVLEILHRSAYFYLVNEDHSFMIVPLGAVFFVGIVVAYLSPAGLRLRYVESDIELAEMYGVDTEKYVLLTVGLTTSIVMVAGYLYAGVLAIDPAVGFGYLLSGIVISAIAAQLNLRGVWHYVAVFAASFMSVKLLGVLL